MKRHGEVFSQLLFDRRLREQVRTGDWSAVSDVADAFLGTDLGELEKLAIAVRDGLLRGSLGGLSISRTFKDTIAALGGGAEAVTEHFLAAHRDCLPIDGTGRRAGISVLESFYEWAAEQLMPQPAELCRAQHELAVALLTTLTRTPRPGFLVRWPLVHPGQRGSYCVLDAARPLNSPLDQPEQPVIYLAVGGRYAAGRLSPTLAAVVLEGADDPPRWVAEQLSLLDPAELNAARRALSARGLS